MLKNSLCRLGRNRRGQSLVEYGILVGAIAVVCLAATSLLGHKVNDLIGIAASLLPGHDDNVGAVASGELVQTTNTNGVISITGTPGNVTTNLGLTNPGALVVDAAQANGSGGSGSGGSGS